MAKQVKQQINKIQDYQAVFGSVAGVRVLQDMMHAHHIMSSTFSSDSLEMALKEGERNVILRILTIMKLDINQLRERIEEDEKIRDNEHIV